MVVDVRGLPDRVPDGVRRVAQRCYYTFDPRLSWSARRRMEAVDRRFVERFFEDESEFEDYRREFFDGRVVDVCMDAAARVPDDLTIYDAHRETCAKLYALVRKRTPETLVETGVYNGVSTLATLLALDRNDAGTLYSVDCSRQLGGRADDDAGTTEPFYERGRPSCSEPRSTVVPAGHDPGWIVPDDLRDRWEYAAGRSPRRLVELLPSVGPVDLYWHDSEVSTSRMLFEFELAWEWLAEDGIVLSPHVGRNDAFETFVGERECEHGLFDYLYDVGYDDYDEACSGGYVVPAR